MFLLCKKEKEKRGAYDLIATQQRGRKRLVEEADMDSVPNNSSRKGSNACQGEDPASSLV
jgi:hypothetical protein